jgi:hypothetical protein
MTEPDYPPPVSELLTLGDCREMQAWPDYLALGLGPQHIPNLIRMALEEELYWADSDSLEVWAPVHAWRALGQLRAEAAAEPLTRLFARIDELDDDWAGEELPKIFGMIGSAAIPALRDYLADPSHDLWARVAAAESLGKIGQQHPDARDECVAVLAEQLEQFADLDPTLNAFIINSLVDLKAVEAAPVIERAFAADCVDLSILGDWEEAQIALGLLQERQTPRPHFHLQDSISRLREPPESQPTAAEKPEPAQKRQDKRSSKVKRKAKRKQQKRSRKKQRKRK